MIKIAAVISLIFVCCIGAKPTEPFPQAEITNGLIHARIYLPDANTGYYRGSRFDWSGIMPELEYQGHSYFGQWFEKYSPTMHDAVMGPAEDFLPVGYDEAKAGETFLKVGVGIVEKPEEPKYSIVTPYKIINAGVWSVKKKADVVEFMQNLDDKDYAYEYKKTVQLIKGKPDMVLLHVIKNTGKKTIETTVYNHNFFMMDKQPIGPGYVVKFLFKPVSEAQSTGEGDLGKIQENEILFLRKLVNKEHLFYQSLTGFDSSAKDYDIRVENYNTGAGVRITSNKPLSKLAFWSAPATLCPEPFTKIKVSPGQEFSWKILYEFYTKENQSK